MESIIECLLKLLHRDVVENCKNCGEYFELFRSYASLVSHIMHRYDLNIACFSHLDANTC